MRAKIAGGVVAGVLVGVLAARAWAAPQPNMEAALGHLEQAKAALERGEHNKAGHRVKALELVQQAIQQTRDGIAAGNH